MAALIKNALIKQLSKYLKNVSANQINISTLKGEGEMKNIQLDENVLMEVLEFPTWLRITNARCNKATLKIQWTKLKTHPIIISLDKIELDVEIADPLREYTTSKDSKLFDKDFGGSYGFIDKCIDAIQLNIDSVTVTIKSNKFNANLNMSNIYVYSVTPNWRVTNDIRNTRIKDLEREEIIVFKEISWEICRLEAYNVDPDLQSSAQQQQATSIKLIMNPSKIQIAVKKKMTDKSMICSTFRVLLNEIYWMANDTQVKAAMGTYSTISKLMKKSFAQKRKYTTFDSQQQQHQQQAQQPLNKSKSSTSSQKPQQLHQQPEVEKLSKVFNQFDIKETSLHLLISVLNIHIYADDNYSGNKLIDGGAIQLLFKNLAVDHYPYHKYGSPAHHWHMHNPTFRQREDWSRSLFAEFIDKLERVLNSVPRVDELARVELKSGMKLLEACTVFTLKDFCMYKATTNLSNKSASVSGMKSKKTAAPSPSNTPSEGATTTSSKTPNDMIRNDTYFLEQQLFNKKPFVSSNYAEFNLPAETLFAQVFFSEFYFPEDANYPAPAPQVFAQLAPLLVNVDFLTLLWINTLMFSLYREKQNVDELNSKTTNKKTETTNSEAASNRFNLHCDTYFEMLLPKVSLSVYPADMQMHERLGFVNRPSGIEIGCSRVVLSNQSLTRHACATRVDSLRSTNTKCVDLAKNLVARNTKFLRLAAESESKTTEIELNQMAPCFADLINNENLPYVRYDLACESSTTTSSTTKKAEALTATGGLFIKSLNKNALNKAASKDVWLVELDSAWVDFLGFVDDHKHALIQNLSLKVWIVNVWDFYNCANFLNSTCADKIGEMQRAEAAEKARRACEKLANIIQISPKKTTASDDGQIDDTTNRFADGVLKMKKRSSSLSLASSVIRDSKKSDYLCKKLYSRLNVITELGEVKITLSHSKVLFLLRMLDIVDLFGQQLKQDTENTFKYKLGSGSSRVAADAIASSPPTVKDKNNNSSGSTRGRQQRNSSSSKLLTRINSTNLADWFINGIIEDKFDESFTSLKSQKTHAQDNDEDGIGNVSVNLAVHVGSVELELSINDLVKEPIGPVTMQPGFQNRPVFHNCSTVNAAKTVVAAAAADISEKINDATRPSSLILDVAAAPQREDTLTAINDLPSRLSPAANNYSSDDHDEFEVIHRQLDREFMFNYIKYVYGLSADNSSLFVNQSLNYSMTTSTSAAVAAPSTPSSDHSGVNEFTERDRSSSISSISSSVSSSSNLTVGFSIKNSSSLLISSLTKAASGTKLSSNNNRDAYIDQDDLLNAYTDDNDNNVLLAALEQEADNVSMHSVDTAASSHQILNASSMFTAAASTAIEVQGLMKTSSTCSAISSSGISSTTDRPQQQQQLLASASDKMITSCSFSSNVSDSNSSSTSAQRCCLTQTTPPTRTITIKLNDLDVYTQTLNDNVVALVRVDRLRIEHRDGQDRPENTDNDQQTAETDILIKFKRLADDFHSRNGLLECLIEQLKFDVDAATLAGLAEFIDDTSDNFVMTNIDLSPKEMLPVDVFVRDCRFLLKDEPASPLDNNPKLVDLTIERLNVSILPTKQIVLNEMVGLKSNSNDDGGGGGGKLKMKKFHDLDSLIKFHNEFDIVEKRLDNKSSSDKFASLVYMLRKAKEDYCQLRAKLEADAARFAEEKVDLAMKLNLSTMENRELKKTIRSLTEAKEAVVRDGGNSGGGNSGEFELTNKRDSQVDQFELERKQFECLLKQFEEDNETLRAKLHKAEDHIQILNIERECLMKNINKIKN